MNTSNAGPSQRSRAPPHARTQAVMYYQHVSQFPNRHHSHDAFTQPTGRAGRVFASEGAVLREVRRLPNGRDIEECVSYSYLKCDKRRNFGRRTTKVEQHLQFWFDILTLVHINESRPCTQTQMMRSREYKLHGCINVSGKISSQLPYFTFGYGLYATDQIKGSPLKRGTT